MTIFFSFPFTISCLVSPAERIRFILGEEDDGPPPPQLFTELDELLSVDGQELEWKETARWTTQPMPHNAGIYLPPTPSSMPLRSGAVGSVGRNFLLYSLPCFRIVKGSRLHSSELPECPYLIRILVTCPVWPGKGSNSHMLWTGLSVTICFGTDLTFKLCNYSYIFSMRYKHQIKLFLKKTLFP